MAKHKLPADRKAEIVAAGLKVAKKHGFTTMRQQDIAEAAGCGYGTVNLCFGTMKQVRRAVMRAAIQQGELVVIAQGLGCMDPDARKAPQEVKEKALALLAR